MSPRTSARSVRYVYVHRHVGLSGPAQAQTREKSGEEVESIRVQNPGYRP